jgi:hypothetical protein
MATYDEILAEITKSRKGLGGDSVSINEGSPAYEALVGVYGPELAKLLDKPIEQKGPLLPDAAPQNKLQQQAIQQQLTQAGYGTATFDPTTGAFTGIDGATAANPYGTGGTGIAGYQKYLDDATTAAGASQDLIIDPLTGKARPAAGSGALTKSDAALDKADVFSDKADAFLGKADVSSDKADAFIGKADSLLGKADASMGQAGATMGKARTAFDAAQAAAAAGQGAGDPFLQAAQGYQQGAQGYTGPNAYRQFMSPYQQDVIDATMADMNQRLQAQQSQLGASAGNAYGGGRFGVAQGQLASSGAIGQALAGAQLRQQGFNTSQQLANQAYQQQMGLGSQSMGMGTQAMQQALQNQGLYTQAGQNQMGAAQGQMLQGQGYAGLAQNQLGLSQGQLGISQNQQGLAQNQQGLAQGQLGISQGQMGLSQAQQGQLAQQLQQLGAQGQIAQRMATLQPQLQAQQIGAIGQMGAQQQAQAQTILDTARAAAKQQAYEPYERLSFVGSQLTGLKGGYPGATYSSQAQTGNPTAGILGLLTGAAGLATGIGSMMGGNNYFS